MVDSQKLRKCITISIDHKKLNKLLEKEIERKILTALNENRSDFIIDRYLTGHIKSKKFLSNFTRIYETYLEHLNKVELQKLEQYRKQLVGKK